MEMAMSHDPWGLLPLDAYPREGDRHKGGGGGGTAKKDRASTPSTSFPHDNHPRDLLLFERLSPNARGHGFVKRPLRRRGFSALPSLPPGRVMRSKGFLGGRPHS